MLHEYTKEQATRNYETQKSESTHEVDKAIIMNSSPDELKKSGQQGSSSNSVNKAFVIYGEDNDEDDHEQRIFQDLQKKESQESPIFFGNNNDLNDTSSFLNEQKPDEELADDLNFNLPLFPEGK